MTFASSRLLQTSFALFVLFVATARLEADDKKDKKTEKKTPAPMQTVKLAGGKLTLKAPGNWKQVKPKVRIIECEFLIPAAKGDERDGRMTIMTAGGSIQANLDRWIGQFKQPADGIVRENAKIEKKQIAGMTVHTVRITGAFQDRPNGPFGAAVERKDYIMLAAILETKNAGNYFIKFYGPQRTIADQSTPFQKMLESLDVK